MTKQVLDITDISKFLPNLNLSLDKKIKNARIK